MFCFDIRFRMKRDGKFWLAECLDYPVFTQGKTKEEATQNLREAFLLYAEDPDVQVLRPELKQIFLQKEWQVQALIPLQLSFSLPQTTYGSLTDFIRQGVSGNPE